MLAKMQMLTIVGGGLALSFLTGSAFFLGRANHPKEVPPPTDSVVYNVNINPTKPDPNSEQQLQIAKSMLSLGQTEAATQLLQKLIANGGTTEKEATELLAKSVGLPASDVALPPVYRSDMTPAQVVKGYFAANKWQERLPFVVNPKQVSPVMAIYYKNTQQLYPNKYKPGLASVGMESKQPGLSGKWIVAVDMSESNPEQPIWTYVIVRTSEGFKIDWEHSFQLQEKERSDFTRRALGLENPNIDYRVARINQAIQGSRYVTCIVELTNNSNRSLRFFNVDADLFDISGNLVGHGSTSGTDLRPGQPQTVSFFIDVNSVHINRCKVALNSVSIEVNGRNEYVQKYFTLRQKS